MGWDRPNPVSKDETVTVTCLVEGMGHSCFLLVWMKRNRMDDAFNTVNHFSIGPTCQSFFLLIYNKSLPLDTGARAASPPPPTQE